MMASVVLPVCQHCLHAPDERRPAGSGLLILTCDCYRSLADGVTRIPCDAVRNFRCGIQASGFESKGKGAAK